MIPHGLAAIVFGCLTLAPTVVAAAEDPMETQRCIWRCLAEHGHGKAYMRCADTRCSGRPVRRTRRHR